VCVGFSQTCTSVSGGGRPLRGGRGIRPIPAWVWPLKGGFERTKPATTGEGRTKGKRGLTRAWEGLQLGDGQKQGDGQWHWDKGNIFCVGECAPGRMKRGPREQVIVVGSCTSTQNKKSGTNPTLIVCKDAGEEYCLLCGA